MGAEDTPWKGFGPRPSVKLEPDVAEVALVRALRGILRGSLPGRPAAGHDGLARSHGRRPAGGVVSGDQVVERGAHFLEELSQRARIQGGLAAKFASDLAEDAVFLRKLKPSLVAARLRGEAPTNGRVQSHVVPPPEPSPAPLKKKGGLNPFVVAGAALAAGILAAKLVDWRGHAHPRD